MNTYDDTWVLATPNKPLLWQRDTDENWVLQPLRRYVFNAGAIRSLEGHLEEVSHLKGSRLHRPLRAGVTDLSRGRILVERCRERGIGDLLFLTGPLSYLRHVSGGLARIHVYGLSERVQVIDHHPALEHGTALRGPLQYEELGLYEAQWFVDPVTEYTSLADQPNVYDALFAQIGLDPAEVPYQFKRPSVTLTPADDGPLEALQVALWQNVGLDLRRTEYYVACPLAHSTLRCAPYGTWLSVIAAMAERRPTLVCGQVNEGRMPAAGMSFGEFQGQLEELCRRNPGRIVNLLGRSGVRPFMALLARAAALVCLDSGPLYVAQALRVPAVSLWGTHDPAVRLGYDGDYLEAAIHLREACPASPCYAFGGFPGEGKCPRGAAQSTCEPLVAVDPAAVLQRLEAWEAKGQGRRPAPSPGR